MKFKYLQLFIIKYINENDIVIKLKLLTVNRLKILSTIKRDFVEIKSQTGKKYYVNGKIFKDKNI